MNKKLFIIIIFIIIGILLFVGLAIRERPQKEEIHQEMPAGDYQKESVSVNERVLVEEAEPTNYLVRLKRGCIPSWDKEFINVLITLRFQFVSVELTKKEKSALEKDPCVLKISTPAQTRENFEKLPLEIQEAVKKKIREQFLAKSILKKDLIDRKKLLEILKKEQPTLPKEIVSHYQLYITPASLTVTQLADAKTPHQLYQEAISWIWVSEQTLNHQEEKWLKPEEFLAETPTYSTNPVPGKIVSDCSEQANSLVSLLRTVGVPAEQVRVVLGEVNFEGEIGGHAWVQIFDDGVWVDLDPTSGPYWDDENKRLVQSPGLSWNYFKFFPFPVLKTWVYYNDKHFYDLEIAQGNPPSNWR